mgnify:FL=1
MPVLTKNAKENQRIGQAPSRLADPLVTFSPFGCDRRSRASGHMSRRLWQLLSHHQDDGENHSKDEGDVGKGPRETSSARLGESWARNTDEVDRPMPIATPMKEMATRGLVIGGKGKGVGEEHHGHVENGEVIAINELSECNERGRPLLDESRAIFTHIDRAGRVVVRGGWIPSSRDTHV